MLPEPVLRTEAHHDKSLVIRGGLARTFGSLVGFFALICLLLGLYLLREAFAHPLDAQAGGILAAALSITLSAILFYFLLKPKPRHDQPSRTAHFKRVG